MFQDAAQGRGRIDSMNTSRRISIELFDPSLPDERAKLSEWMDKTPREDISDTLDAQLEELIRCRMPGRRDPVEATRISQSILGGIAPAFFGRWVRYPWSRRLLRVLPPEGFAELRWSRNRNKITASEQSVLQQKSVGVVGLSVGNSIANALALEGVGGCLKLADFDALELSNLNRVRASLADLGLNKAVIAARQIADDEKNSFMARRAITRLKCEQFNHMPIRILEEQLLGTIRAAAAAHRNDFLSLE